MCTTCGCGPGEVRIEMGNGEPAPLDGQVNGRAHAHAHHAAAGHHHRGHDDHHQHDHGHPHDHAHSDGHEHGTIAPARTTARTIQLERDILAKNQRFADANRAFLRRNQILALNMMSSPGSGKTSLLVETLKRLEGVAAAVIEGDQQTSNDAERIRSTGCPAIQINTGKGCHLDAHAVGHAMEHLSPVQHSLLFVENVGNLVCPAAFDLGETKRVVLLSVTEGEDKPMKYPDMFAVADVVLLTKVDLVPHLDIDMVQLRENVRSINRRAALLEVSIRGDGLQPWLDWLQKERRALMADERARLAAQVSALDAALATGA